MSYYKFHNDCQSSVLTYEQVKRLDFVMDQTVPIHGRGNFPTLYVKLKELIRLVKHKLQKEHSIEIRDVRLNGGGASYVLAPENSHYNDLDLIFCTDLSNEDQFDVIRDVVLDCLKEFYPKESTAVATTTSSNNFSCSGSRSCCGSNSYQQHKNEKKESQFNNIIDNGTSTSSRSSNSTKSGEEDKDNDDIIQICDKNTEIQNGRLNDKKQQTKNNKTVKTVKEEEEESEEKNYHRLSSTNCQLMTPTTTSNNTTAASSNVGNVKQTSLQMPPNNCAMKEAYVHKMVKVNDDDRWSLISLGVQQSESTSGQQAMNGSISGLNNHCTSERYFPLLPSTRNLENRCDANCKQQTTGLGEVAGVTNNMNAQQLAAANHHQSYHHQHHHQNHQIHNNHHYQVQQKQYRPKQFPNSIELKFVDRMRRKFEFSVDSFQIILDSLIQFYDYAPKPSFASQRDLMSSHPSSTVINTRPMIMSKRCSTDCCSASADCLTSGHRMESNFDGYNKLRVHRDSFSTGSTGSTDCGPKGGQCHHHHHRSSSSSTASSSSSSENEFNTTSKTSCVGPLVGTRSYYQYQLDNNSPSLTSEASSSGCSSSSSVVSSSSSSLSSCDEDHEDLSCDVDGQSSSSASTSSLLSSSVYSSDGGATFSSSNPSDEQRLLARSGTDARIINSKTKKHASSSNKNEKTSQKVATSKAATASKSIVSRTLDPQVACDEMIGNCCAGLCCLCSAINNYDDTNEYDFETDDSTSCAVISENFYPTVIGRSEYGNFKEALYHLEKKLIATRSPEEIRGGGLLKYCNLLVKNYKPTNVYQIRTLERYMCSRFFIDFSDLNQQQAKLESYLANHFSDDLMLKIDYLTILHNVVQRSTVCLMNHELRLTLEMIKDMAFKMNDHQQRQGHHLNQLHHQQQAAHMQSHINTSQIEMTAVTTSTAAPATVAQQQHQNQQVQQQHHQLKQYFSNQHPPKPMVIQSGVYRVKLVNYSLAKPATTTATAATK